MYITEIRIHIYLLYLTFLFLVFLVEMDWRNVSDPVSNVHPGVRSIGPIKTDQQETRIKITSVIFTDEFYAICDVKAVDQMMCDQWWKLSEIKEDRCDVQIRNWIFFLLLYLGLEIWKRQDISKENETERGSWYLTGLCKWITESWLECMIKRQNY